MAKFLYGIFSTMGDCFLVPENARENGNHVKLDKVGKARTMGECAAQAIQLAKLYGVPFVDQRFIERCNLPGIKRPTHNGAYPNENGVPHQKFLERYELLGARVFFPVLLVLVMLASMFAPMSVHAQSEQPPHKIYLPLVVNTTPYIAIFAGQSVYSSNVSFTITKYGETTILKTPSDSDMIDQIMQYQDVQVYRDGEKNWWHFTEQGAVDDDTLGRIALSMGEGILIYKPGTQFNEYCIIVPGQMYYSVNVGGHVFWEPDAFSVSDFQFMTEFTVLDPGMGYWLSQLQLGSGKVIIDGPNGRGEFTLIDSGPWPGMSIGIGYLFHYNNVYYMFR